MNISILNTITISSRRQVAAGTLPKFSRWSALALAVVVAVEAQGADSVWTALGDGVSFHDPANWTQFTVPTSNRGAIFDTVGAIMVTFTAAPTTKSLGVHETAVGFNLGGLIYTVIDELVVGDLGGEIGVFHINNGTVRVLNIPLVLDDEIRIGRLAGSIGNITINAGGVLDGPGDMLIGDQGEGAVFINAGGTLATTGTVMLGDDALTSDGTVNVDGAGALWSVSSLTVANGKQGVVNIMNQGLLNSTTVFVGDNILSHGSINVSGTGVWNNSATCFIGNGGTGMVNLTGGGTVVCLGVTEIGDNFASSTGVINIDGSGSTWTQQGNMLVGNIGDGTINVINGGDLTSNGVVFLGDLFGANGRIIVDGIGSTWGAQTTVAVGNVGTGALTIQNGGAATISGLTKVGDNLGGATGTITVDGVGSSLSVLSEMFIANFGTGFIDITGGGQMNSTRVKIGDEAGSSGAGTVSGVGSTWTDTVEMFVGNFGTGSLTISGGGTVSGVRGTLGDDPGSNGTVTVSGAGSSWTNSLGLRIGDLGTGSLTVSGGASGSAAGVIMGFGFGSSGSLSVENANSVFTSQGNLEVAGGFGQGMVRVSDGGHIQVNGVYTQKPLGSMSVEIGPNFVSAVSATGLANLGGTLNITLLPGFTPPDGAIYDLITASSFSGAFSSISAPVGFNVTVEAGRIFAQAPIPPPPLPCPADCFPVHADGSTGDGVVQIFDLISIINNYGVAGGFGPCDIFPESGDGIVNIFDLIMLINNYGPCP